MPSRARDRVFDDERGVLRDDDGAVRDAGRCRGSLDDAPARRAFVDQQVQIIAVELEIGDLVIEAGEGDPFGLTGNGIVERCDEPAALGSDVGELQDRVA